MALLICNIWFCVVGIVTVIDSKHCIEVSYSGTSRALALCMVVW